MDNVTIGMDIGDKNHALCVLNQDGIKLRNKTLIEKKGGICPFPHKELRTTCR